MRLAINKKREEAKPGKVDLLELHGHGTSNIPQSTGTISRMAEILKVLEAEGNGCGIFEVNK